MLLCDKKYSFQIQGKRVLTADPFEAIFWHQRTVKQFFLRIKKLFL